MKSKYAKIVRHEFAKRLSEEFPLYIEDKEGALPRDSKLYKWTHEKGITFFILLLFNPKGNGFTIEGAWGNQNIFPIDEFPDLPYEHIEHRDRLRLRIYDLWRQTSQDFWWKVGFCTGEDVLENKIEVPANQVENAPICVEEAVQKIKKYLLPYYDNILELKTK